MRRILAREAAGRGHHWFRLRAPGRVMATCLRGKNDDQKSKYDQRVNVTILWQIRDHIVI
jgi:hypothetical protein